VAAFKATSATQSCLNRQNNSTIMEIKIYGIINTGCLKSLKLLIILISKKYNQN